LGSALVDTINDHFVRCRDEDGIYGDLTFRQLHKSAATAARNKPKERERQIELLVDPSPGFKEHIIVRRNLQLACEAIER
jgi:hypothetical protein